MVYLRVELLKTQMCRRGELCSYRDQQTGVVEGCWFAHGDAELRCPTFARYGHCFLGDGCTKRHTPPQLACTINVDQLYARSTWRSVGYRPEVDGVTYVRDLPRILLPAELQRQIAVTKEEAITRKSMFLGGEYLRARYRATPPLTTSTSIVDMKVYIGDAFNTLSSAKKFLQCNLEVEFAQAKSDMRRYDIPESLITPTAQAVHGGALFRIDCPGLQEKRPSVIRGDTIIARDNRYPDDGTNSSYHKGFVHYVNLDHVLVSFDTRYFNPNPTISYHVIFVFLETNYRRQLMAIHAVETMLTLDETPEFAEDPSEPVPGSAIISRRLNRIQLEAAMRMACTDLVPGKLALLLLHGPPGTGKTTTIVDAVETLIRTKPSEKILIATPSNESANLVCERLLKKFPEGHLKPAGGSSTSTHVGGGLIRLCALSYDIGKACPTAVIPYAENKTVTKQRLEGVQVVITTMMTTGLLYGVGVNTQHFQHIIVDEAGQATEPELLIPLLFVNRALGTRITLAGDHKQLGPILRSKVCEGLDFGRSTLERLMNEPTIQGRHSIQLTVSYRAHPAILRLYNEITYKGSLTAEADPRVTDSLVEYLGPNPVKFIHVEGAEEREADSPSWMNVKEVHVTVDLIEFFLSVSVRPVDIVVLAPYNKQCKKIQGVLHQKFLNAESNRVWMVPGGYNPKRPPIKVCSVESFQGREAKLIILSCVRSKEVGELGNDLKQSIGFLRQPKRLNVAISRAQAGLIIVGNAGVLQQDDSGASWKELLLKLLEQQCVRLHHPTTTAWTIRQRGVLGTFPELTVEHMSMLGSVYKDSYTRQQNSESAGHSVGGVAGANPTDTEWRRMD